VTALLLVRTGTANVASVRAAFRREGLEPELSEDAGAVRAAERVILPGVGAFGTAMENLARAGLASALRERIAAGRPTLAVCLGLQLLGRSSEESPGVAGLGVLPVSATRFPEGELRVPHLGWNRVVPDAPADVGGVGGGGGGSALLAEGYAYFAHTYRLTEVPDGWAAARCDYGGPFVAALERGPVLACQFHPELSGAYGRRLLRAWLERSAVSC